MKKLSATISIVCALAWPAVARAQQAPPPTCRLLLASSLTMTTDPDGRVTVPAAIGIRPVQLLVDTGGIYSAISSAISDEMRLSNEPAPREIMAGNLPITSMVEVEKFQIGRQHADNFRMMVLPSHALDVNDDGLLGTNILKFYDIEFDFAQNKFNIFSQDHCKGAVVYWTTQPYAAIPMQLDEDWHITVPVTINGKEITATIDTGAAQSVMTLEAAEDLGITAKDPAMKNAGDISLNGAQATAVYRYPFPALTLQGLTVNHPDIVLIPKNAFFRYGRGPQLLLGVSVLRQLHLYIAYGERTLYVTPAEAR